VNSAYVYINHRASCHNHIFLLSVSLIKTKSWVGLFQQVRILPVSVFVFKLTQNSVNHTPILYSNRHREVYIRTQLLNIVDNQNYNPYTF